MWGIGSWGMGKAERAERCPEVSQKFSVGSRCLPEGTKGRGDVTRTSELEVP